MTASIRRKCFISYHHADEEEVGRFIRTYDSVHDVFIHRMLGTMNTDIVDSADTDYVMRRIREQYLGDSTVTIVLVGSCTWARRYVDWEIQASLRRGETTIPNGLLGIVLPSAANAPNPPERLGLNLPKTNGAPGYASWIMYPTGPLMLRDSIEAAYQRRTSHVALIQNPRQRMLHNRQCP